MADDVLKDLPTALLENYVLLNAALEQQNTGKFESMLSYQEKLHSNIQNIMQSLETAPSLAVVMPGSTPQLNGSTAPAVRWLLSPPLLPPTPAAAMAPPPPPPPRPPAAAAAVAAGDPMGTAGTTHMALAAQQPQQQAPDASGAVPAGQQPPPHLMAALAGAAPELQQQQQQQQQAEDDSLNPHHQPRRSSGTGSHVSGVGPVPAHPQLMQLHGYALQQQQQQQQQQTPWLIPTQPSAGAGLAAAAGEVGAVAIHGQDMYQLQALSVPGTSQPQGSSGLQLGASSFPSSAAMVGGAGMVGTAPSSSNWLSVVNTSAAGFLQVLGLERFEPLLQENDVDMAALQLMTEQHLKDLGLPIGAVVKIRAALARQGV